MIIQYDAISDGTEPDYIESGGFFSLVAGGSESLIGVGVAIPQDAPDTTVSITRDQLINRVQGVMDGPNPYAITVLDGNPTPTVTEIVDLFCKTFPMSER